jgi:hypothetical protein
MGQQGSEMDYTQRVCQAAILWPAVQKQAGGGDDPAQKQERSGNKPSGKLQWIDHTGVPLKKPHETPHLLMIAKAVDIIQLQAGKA